MNILTKSYSDDIFKIDEENGFLPIKDPYEKLPEKMNDLQELLDNLPKILSEKDLIEKKVKDLNNYSEYVDTIEDKFILQSIFRAYAFITSAYLLEPAHQYYLDHKTYAFGRTKLPKHISVPFVKVSEKLKVHPWLDYHYAYSLCNYKRIDKTKGLEWENLDMCNRFSGTTDETGFIMLHVDINRYGKDLISSIKKFLSGDISSGLNENYNAMVNINKIRMQMWKASNYKNYHKFRAFIMGITGNTGIFGDGVVYENCFHDKPQQFRGQSGSQDDIIPTEDVFSGVINYYPENKLTEYLLDMRKYRPVVVQEFLTDLKGDCENNFKLVKESGKDDLIRLLKVINQIYLFRNGHWQFVQNYIMMGTKYAVATGGTPITQWLINQIEACLKYMNDIIELIGNTDDIKSSDLKAEFESLRKEQHDKIDILCKQVIELKKTDYSADLIYDLNKDFKERK